MINKGRSPNLRHVSRTHETRFGYGHLIESVWTSEFRVRYARSCDQLVELPTKGTFLTTEYSFAEFVADWECRTAYRTIHISVAVVLPCWQSAAFLFRLLASSCSIVAYSDALSANFQMFTRGGSLFGVTCLNNYASWFLYSSSKLGGPLTQDQLRSYMVSRVI